MPQRAPPGPPARLRVMPPASVGRTLLLSLAVLTCVNAQAQDRPTTGRVVGLLRDATGAVVRAATVEIRGLDSSYTTTSVTNVEGRYAFNAVPAGRYVVEAAA